MLHVKGIVSNLSWINGYNAGLRHRISEFEVQLYFYFHFRTNTLRKGVNPFILPLLFFYNDGFGIK